MLSLCISIAVSNIRSIEIIDSFTSLSILSILFASYVVQGVFPVREERESHASTSTHHVAETQVVEENSRPLIVQYNIDGVPVKFSSEVLATIQDIAKVLLY